MRALQYHVSIPRYLLARALGRRIPIGMLPLRVAEMPEPTLPEDFTYHTPYTSWSWHPVKVRLCGICGSDLALLYGKSSPRLSPFFSFPCVPGHEILGELDGTRVVVNPILSCLDRVGEGVIEERCEACERGDEHLCLNVAEGKLSPGMIGFCRDMPGGWGPSIVSHSRRLHDVPEGVTDERALLAEPLAVALRGVSRGLETKPRNILVIGSGTIGLLSIKVARILGFAGVLHASARYSVQAEAAVRLGADKIHRNVAEAQQSAGAKAYKPVVGRKVWRGGFDLVVEASGSENGLEQASWAVREGGTVVLLGGPGGMKHDFSPWWFRDLTLIGSYTYTSEEFRQAVGLLPHAEGIESLVTHRFPISDWRGAIGSMVSRRALKAVFSHTDG